VQVVRTPLCLSEDLRFSGVLSDFETDLRPGLSVDHRCHIAVCDKLTGMCQCGKHTPYKTNCSSYLLSAPSISHTLPLPHLLHKHTIASPCPLQFPIRVLLPRSPLRLALQLLPHLPLPPCLPRMICSPHKLLARRHHLGPPVCCRLNKLNFLPSSWTIRRLHLGGQSYSRRNSTVTRHHQHRHTLMVDQHLKMVGLYASI
jgi:hypothetical protein